MLGHDVSSLAQIILQVVKLDRPVSIGMNLELNAFPIPEPRPALAALLVELPI